MVKLIVDTLVISAKTDRHRANMLQKLDLPTGWT